MTDPTTTTTTEWGVGYTWPDGTVQIVWEGADRLMAEASIRHLAASEERTEAARLVTRTTTVTISPTAYADMTSVVRSGYYDGPPYDLGPIEEDDPTMVVPADTFATPR